MHLLNAYDNLGIRQSVILLDDRAERLSTIRRCVTALDIELMEPNPCAANVAYQIGMIEAELAALK